MAGPLSNVRVLDLSRVLAGPWAGQNLADLGAEVIKVERPKTGDDSRAFGPPWLKDATGNETRESAYFACANRGKKSITLDLSKPEGSRIVRSLAARADVLIENYKFGDLARYGLGYDDLKPVNPRLIYCSVTGFGQTGPYRERPGYDFMIQGMGGLMSITGERDELPGGGPQKAGIPIANYLATGVSPKRLGNAHPNIVPYQAFKSADGDVILACGNDNLFRKFCEVADCRDLAVDPRFATNDKRVVHRAELDAILAGGFAKRTTRDWVEALEAAGVPNGPINTLEQVFAEPQAIARGLRLELAHPAAGQVSLVRSPMRFSTTPIEHERPPPLLGQHTDEILRGVLGLSEPEISKLRAEGVV
jgi:crotonobetainyl-CoA:carnitine CoA-transferase CaiB-like acyl-CoA transferase